MEKQITISPTEATAKFFEAIKYLSFGDDFTSINSALRNSIRNAVLYHKHCPRKAITFVVMNLVKELASWTDLEQWQIEQGIKCNAAWSVKQLNQVDEEAE